MIKYIIIFILIILGVRYMYIQSLISKIPKELRELKLPYPGNPEKLKDREGKEYTSVDNELISKLIKKKKYVQWLPFEKKTNILSDRWEMMDGIVIFKYNHDFFKNLQKNDKITGFQLGIHTGLYRYMGEPSGKRIITVPEDINLKKDQFKIYMLNVAKNYKFSDKIDINSFFDDKQLVKQGLEWEAKDWPFGRNDNNLYGPHIDFDSKFEYLGEDLLIIIQNKKTFNMGFQVIKSENEFNNFVKYKYLDRSYNNKYGLDIRLELERNNQN